MKTGMRPVELKRLNYSHIKLFPNATRKEDKKVIIDLPAVLTKVKKVNYKWGFRNPELYDFYQSNFDETKEIYCRTRVTSLYKIDKLLDKMLEKLGISEKKYSLYSFRKFLGTNLFNNMLRNFIRMH